MIERESTGVPGGRAREVLYLPGVFLISVSFREFLSYGSPSGLKGGQPEEGKIGKTMPKMKLTNN